MLKNEIVVVVKGLIKQNNKVLVIKRSSNDEVGAGTWEFVGGKIDFGEKLEEALQREIEEETKLVVTVGQLLYATTFMTKSNRQVVLLTYLCHSVGTEVTLSHEHDDYQWCETDQLHQYLNIEIMMELEKNNCLSYIK
ncbi:NUDIX domain-containing protein [Bacillus sp. BGMRC 2118]|nr:NUDIX domain-containing protein [Bacillus sp. BGMRC 2118]